MWGRKRYRANPSMVHTWGRSSRNKGMGSSSNLCRTHGRTALSSSRGDGGGRRGHNSGGGDSGGGRRSSGGGKARVGLGGRGRRGAAHPRSEAISFTCLQERRGWEEESFRGDGEEMEWLEMKMNGGDGGGGGCGGGWG